jgi:hypothetical protein
VATSSNNASSFQGNAATSSNGASSFIEIVTVNGGGSVGPLYNFYPLELITNENISSGGGWQYVGDGATALRVQRVQTESPYDFSSINAILMEFQWPVSYGDGVPEHAGLEAYLNEYVAAGTLSPEKAVPLANMIMKLIVRTGGI